MKRLILLASFFVAAVSACNGALAQSDGTGRKSLPVADRVEVRPALLKLDGPALPSMNYQIPITRLGTIELGDSVAVISSESIGIFNRYEVEYKHRMPLLSGNVVCAETCDAAGGGGRINGLVVFNDGSLVSQLPESSAHDLVFRHIGSIGGQIINATSSSVTLRTKDGSLTKIPSKTITFLRSPRAFIFVIDEAANRLPRPGAANDSGPSLSFKSTAATDQVTSSSVVPQKKKNLLDELDEDMDDDFPSIFGRQNFGHDNMPSQFNRQHQF